MPGDDRRQAATIAWAPEATQADLYRGTGRPRADEPRSLRAEPVASRLTRRGSCRPGFARLIVWATGATYGAIELAGRIKSGAVHINDQTVDDEAVAPFGGTKASGTGGRFGGKASLDTFGDVQWITAQEQIERYPF